MNWRQTVVPLARVVLLFSCIVLAGCAEKAQALRIAATQFETEAGAAIRAIDDMRRQEVAPVAQSASEQSQEFTKNLEGLNQPVTAKILPTLLRPNEVARDPAVERAWADFLGDLRLQYSEFRSIFDHLEQGSFLGRNAVADAKPYAEKLTAQLAYFAATIEKSPPQFLQQRVELVVDLRKIKRDIADKNKKADATSAAARWRDKWLALEESEAKLQRDTIAQLTKAAVIGKSVRDKIAAYNQISVEDIANGTAAALRLAESVTGEDLSHAKGQAQKIVADINNDPVWNSVAKSGLDKIDTVIAERSKPVAGS